MGGDYEKEMGGVAKMNLQNFKRSRPLQPLKWKMSKYKKIEIVIHDCEWMYTSWFVCQLMRRESMLIKWSQLHNDTRTSQEAEVSKSWEVNLLLLFSSQQVRKKKMQGNKEHRFTKTTPNVPAAFLLV